MVMVFKETSNSPLMVLRGSLSLMPVKFRINCKRVIVFDTREEFSEPCFRSSAKLVRSSSRRFIWLSICEKIKKSDTISSNTKKMTTMYRFRPRYGNNASKDKDKKLWERHILWSPSSSRKKK